jgi:hypothetical protein
LKEDFSFIDGYSILKNDPIGKYLLKINLPNKTEIYEKLIKKQNNIMKEIINEKFYETKNQDNLEVTNLFIKLFQNEIKEMYLDKQFIYEKYCMENSNSVKDITIESGSEILEMDQYDNSTDFEFENEDIDTIIENEEEENSYSKSSISSDVNKKIMNNSNSIEMNILGNYDDENEIKIFDIDEKNEIKILNNVEKKILNNDEKKILKNDEIKILKNDEIKILKNDEKKILKKEEKKKEIKEIKNETFKKSIQKKNTEKRKSFFGISFKKKNSEIIKKENKMNEIKENKIKDFEKFQILVKEQMNLFKIIFNDDDYNNFESIYNLENNNIFLSFFKLDLFQIYLKNSEFFENKLKLN